MGNKAIQPYTNMKPMLESESELFVARFHYDTTHEDVVMFSEMIEDLKQDLIEKMNISEERADEIIHHESEIAKAKNWLGCYTTGSVADSVRKNLRRLFAQRGWSDDGYRAVSGSTKAKRKQKGRSAESIALFGK